MTGERGFWRRRGTFAFALVAVAVLVVGAILVFGEESASNDSAVVTGTGGEAAADGSGGEDRAGHEGGCKASGPCSAKTGVEPESADGRATEEKDDVGEEAEPATGARESADGSESADGEPAGEASGDAREDVGEAPSPPNVNPDHYGPGGEPAADDSEPSSEEARDDGPDELNVNPDE